MSRENVEVVRTPLGLPSATRRGRTLDKRLYVRFPTLLPRLVSAVMDLRPRSRARRAFLSRMIRRGWAASDRGDLDLSLRGYDPEAEISRPETGAGQSQIYKACIEVTRAFGGCGRRCTNRGMWKFGLTR